MFVTDNNTVQAALATGRCANKDIMLWIKQLFCIACEFNFAINAVYLASKNNVICDAQSRWKDSASKLRIMEVDVTKRLCCSHLFT